jgi:hypothetical protein
LVSLGDANADDFSRFNPPLGVSVEVESKSVSFGFLYSAQALPLFDGALQVISLSLRMR